MSLQEQHHSPDKLAPRLHPVYRRRLALVICLAAVLLLAFYTLSESAHLKHDPLLAISDWAGYALCHRISERSFNINGRQFPLCARCTGMYLGATLTIMALMLAGRWRRVLLPRRNLFLALLGLIILMGIDGINSYSHFFPDVPHLYEPRNWLRLATGMGAGLTLGIIIMAALAQSLWRTPSLVPIVEDWRELGGILLLGLVAFVLVLSNQSALLYVLAIASTGGLIFVVTALNTAVLLILTRRDGQAVSWSLALVPLLVGLILAILELGTISTIRWQLTGTMSGFPGL